MLLLSKTWLFSLVVCISIQPLLVTLVHYTIIVFLLLVFSVLSKNYNNWLVDVYDYQLIAVNYLYKASYIEPLLNSEFIGASTLVLSASNLISLGWNFILTTNTLNTYTFILTLKTYSSVQALENGFNLFNYWVIISEVSLWPLVVLTSLLFQLVYSHSNNQFRITF